VGSVREFHYPTVHLIFFPPLAEEILCWVDITNSFVYTACMNPMYKLRKDRGWTQAEAAEKAGISQQSWSRFERIDDFVGLSRNAKRKIRHAFGMTWVDMALVIIAIGDTP